MNLNRHLTDHIRLIARKLESDLTHIEPKEMHLELEPNQKSTYEFATQIQISLDVMVNQTKL